EADESDLHGCPWLGAKGRRRQYMSGAPGDFAARIAAITCCAPVAIRRASELTVTNWNPLAIRLSADSGVALWMPATTPCALARARMWSTACAAFGSRSSIATLQPSESERSEGPM